MSTSAVNMWWTVNIWTKNITNVLNRFLSLTQIPPMKQIKTKMLNLKKHKTQVPIEYLTIFFLLLL